MANFIEEAETGFSKDMPRHPQVIDRFPTTDRMQGAFPTELVTFFFDADEGLERIPQNETAESYLGRKLAADNFQQATFTVLDGEIMSCTCHMFYDDLQLVNQALNLRPDIQLPYGLYFLKRGYCLLTSRIQASEELNKINIFLRRAATNGFLFDRFETYLQKFLFEIQIPASISNFKLYLP